MSDLIISGVIDGPLSGGVPKAIELYAVNDIPDLSLYGVESANNGNPSAGAEFTFPAVSFPAGNYLYIASEDRGFDIYFGFQPDYTTSALSINGDDAIALFQNGTIVDVFGEIGVDGTGQAWEHTDGWAYRVAGTGPDGNTFDLNNWTFSGTNALDGETSNATATTPFPTGSFTLATAPTLTVVAAEDFDGNGTNLLSGFDPADSLDGGPGDFFGVGSINNWPQSSGVPFSLADDSVVGVGGGSPFAGDTEGIYGQNSDFDNDFFGISDSDEFGADQTASWTFDISGFTDLELQIDMGGISDGTQFGGFVPQTASFTASIDGGATQTAFALAATTETGDFTFRPMDSGTSTPVGGVLQVTGDNPVTKLLAEDGSEATNTFLNKTPASGAGAGELDTFTTEINGTGSTLTLTLVADFPFEAMAFDNIQILGVPDTSAETTLAIAPTNAVQPEGDSGTTNFTFTVTRSGDTSGATDVDFAVTGDVNAADFGGTLPAGTLSFAPTETSKEITLAVSGDLDAEPDEAFTVVLSNPTGGATITTAVAAGTIQNDDAAALTLISTIQGNAATQLAGGAHDDVSPLDGQSVTIQGVVTGVFPGLSGFFVQEETADSDNDGSTSEGIFVFTGNDPSVSVGNVVTVTGAVDEFFGMTQIDNDNGDLSIVVENAGDNQGLISPAIIDIPATGDIDDFYEQFEGMSVQFSDTLTITEYFNYDRFGEIRLAEGDRPFQFTQTNAPDVDGFAAHLEDLARRTITLDDGSTQQNPDTLPFPDPGFSDSNAFRGGDTITGLSGVLNYAFGQYRVQPTGPIEFESTNPRPTSIEDVGGRLKVVSFNVLNYFTTLDENGNTTANGNSPRGADSATEFDRQTQKLVNAILEIDADILGLVELENDFLPGSSGNAIESLVNALNAELGATVYDWVNPGSQFVDVSDAISVGAIYKVDSVELTPGTSPAILTDANLPADFAGETIFDGPSTNRAPLAVSFTEKATGGSFTVAVNHFKSKGSIFDADNDPNNFNPNEDQGDGQGNNNAIRLRAAQALDAWLQTDPTGSGDPDVMLLGDLNAYAEEDPITFLEGAGYTDLAEAFSGGETPYSFLFDGQLGTLDYAMANTSLFAQVTGATEWHVNADEADALDYNLDFGRDPNLFNGANSFRNSDHDPLIVGLNLDVPNQAPVAGDDAATLDLDRSESVTISVLDNDSDPDGDAISITSVDTTGTLGEVTQNNGTFTYNAHGVFAYLAAGETATDTFSYTVTDSNLTATAEVTVTIAGPEDVFNSGSPFSFRQGTNGGANRFGFDGDAFFILGQGVRGRFKAQDFDPFLVKAAEVFGGEVEATGTINDQRLPSGQGPNILRVTDNDEVVVSGRSIGGRYQVQFGNQEEAKTFQAFVDQMFAEIDENDAVANDPTNFRKDIVTGMNTARVFFDDVKDQFGFTTNGGETQQRFDELELFVEGLADDLFGGTQIRDGRFNAERIADGRIPNIVRVIRNDQVLIGGRSVGGRFQFEFENPTTAGQFANSVETLFDHIGETGAIAIGDQ